LLLCRDDRSGLVDQASPQLLGLLGPLLGLTLPGPRSLEGCVVLLELGTNRDHLRLPLCRHGVRPRQILPRPPQRLVRSISVVRTASTAEAPSVGWPSSSRS
jgi:hypothetical protein